MHAFVEKTGGEKYTYSDYIGWDDNERWEIIKGIPHKMSPAPSTEHQRVVIKLATKLSIFLEEKPCEVFIAPFDVRLPKNNEPDKEIDTIVQPDIIVVCDPAKIDEKGCKGAPDLIIEIISPCSAKQDIKDKFYLYEEKGVKEYWIVFPTEKYIEIYKLQKNGKYGMHETYIDDDIIDKTLLKGVSINLKEIFIK